MTEFLLAISIGPVQSFISQARKTSDLYAGSYILSSTAKFVAEELCKNQGVSIIIPERGMGALPNRLTVSVRAKRASDVASMARQVMVKVNERYRIMLTSICERLNLQVPEAAMKQMTVFPDLHWAIAELQDYAEAFTLAQRKLGTAKTLRPFKQLVETGRKCSVCGERNALFYGGDRLKTSKDALIVPGAGRTRIGNGEGLCGVCFTKRFADKLGFDGFDSRFPSTVRVAVMDARTELERTNPDCLKNYEALFDDFDDELLFYGSINEQYFVQHGHAIERIEDARMQLREIQGLLRQAGVRFGSYYAIVTADGDDMGIWVSGEFIQEKRLLRHFHEGLTRTLSEYANSLREFIDVPRGAAVYTGGDDLLAFANLSHLLSLMKEIHQRFPSRLDSSIPNQATISAGVAIAHYVTPLAEVLDWSRRMEKDAKQMKEKNAFGIALLKRSGEIRLTRMKWSIDGIDILASMETVAGYLRAQLFSEACFRSLEEELRSMGLEKRNGGWPEMVRAEIDRLVSKSSLASSGQVETLPAVTRMSTAVKDLLNAASSVEEFVASLDICMFLSREANRTLGEMGSL